MQVQKQNYQKKLEETIAREQKDGRVPTLLLHSCCAPCSSYVLEYLSEYFKITVLYYNPNISPAKNTRPTLPMEIALMGKEPVAPVLARPARPEAS